MNQPGLICFHLDLSVYGAVRDFAPEGNTIGSLMLHRHIEYLFTQAKLGHGGPGCFPQRLNNCSGVWRVDDVFIGLELIKVGLDYFDFLGERFAEIGWFDPRENFWRNHYPHNSTGNISRHFGFDLEVFTAQMAQRQRELRSAMFHVTQSLTAS